MEFVKFSGRGKCLRNAIGMTMLVLLMPASASTDTGGISPILECVLDNGDGSYTSYWGYNNYCDSQVNIPVGHDNHFTPSPETAANPRRFYRGVLLITLPNVAIISPRSL